MLVLPNWLQFLIGEKIITKWEFLVHELCPVEFYTLNSLQVFFWTPYLLLVVEIND